MSKRKKVVVTTSKSNEDSTKGVKAKYVSPSKSGGGPKEEMLFGIKNYKWMLSGIGLIILGLLLMTGGAMPDKETWDPNLIYSWRRITLAPILLLTGFAFQIVAIFKK